MATANSITKAWAEAEKFAADIENVTKGMEMLTTGPDEFDVQELDDTDMHLMWLENARKGFGRIRKEPEDFPQDPNENKILIFPCDGHLVAAPINPGTKIAETHVKLRDMRNYPPKTKFLFEDPNVVRQFFNPPEEDRAGLAAAYKAATKLILVPFFRLEYLETAKPILPPFLAGAVAVSPSSGVRCVTDEDDDYFTIDGGPIIGKKESDQLFADWRAACRALPRNHRVKEIAIALEGVERVRESFSCRLLQLVSTIFVLKAKGPLRCFLCPTNSYRKDFLKAVLVSSSSDEGSSQSGDSKAEGGKLYV
jgi:hypothetical protein